MPTATRPGYRVATLRTRLVSSSATVPSTTRATPLAVVVGATPLAVGASGGGGSVADIEALAALAVPVPGSGVRRLSGAITGRALVDGRMTVEEGVAACARSV